MRYPIHTSEFLMHMKSEKVTNAAIFKSVATRMTCKWEKEVELCKSTFSPSNPDECEERLDILSNCIWGHLHTTQLVSYEWKSTAWTPVDCAHGMWSCG